jgi:hypothetical protein
VDQLGEFRELQGEDRPLIDELGDKDVVAGRRIDVVEE